MNRSFDDGRWRAPAYPMPIPPPLPGKQPEELAKLYADVENTGSWHHENLPEGLTTQVAAQSGAILAVASDNSSDSDNFSDNVSDNSGTDLSYVSLFNEMSGFPWGKASMIVSAICIPLFFICPFALIFAVVALTQAEPGASRRLTLYALLVAVLELVALLMLVIVATHHT